MLSLVVVTALVALVPDRPNPRPWEPRTPAEQILGDWRFVGSGKEVNPSPRPGSPDYVLRFLPTESVWIERGQPSGGNGLTGKIVIDWAHNPIAIDFIPKRGGDPLRGILKLEGDRLTLAWSNDQRRPADFGSPLSNVHHFLRVRLKD